MKRGQCNTSRVIALNNLFPMGMRPAISVLRLIRGTDWLPKLYRKFAETSSRTGTFM